jgi:dTMP kinase
MPHDGLQERRGETAAPGRRGAAPEGDERRGARPAPHERRGVLITLEGVDGCGKTTQAALLCERLAARSLPVGPASAPGAVIREPGATPAGEAIREVLLHGPAKLRPWTEALLYAAARAELVETVLLPELRDGRVLVLDRFIDSSLAYQGFARGLGVDEVLAANQPALRGLLPDLTLVIDVDPVVGLARSAGARRSDADSVVADAAGSGASGGTGGGEHAADSSTTRPDRIEAEGLGLQRRVAAGFDALAHRWPERVRLIDGSPGINVVSLDIEAAALEAIAAAGLHLGD